MSGVERAVEKIFKPDDGALRRFLITRMGHKSATYDTDDAMFCVNAKIPLTTLLPLFSHKKHRMKDDYFNLP